MAKERDYVHRRIVIEYGRWYAYVYLTDDAGKIIEEEVFKQPFRLELKESAEEAKECWQFLYQYLQDTVLWYATARDDDKKPDSEETQEK